PDRPHPWSIWVADAAHWSTRELWHSGKEPQNSYPYMASDTGGGVIRWAAEDRIVFASEQDGWQHLYSIATGRGNPKLLTAGNCEVENWSFSHDGKTGLFNSNCNDIDRRHLWSVGVEGDHLLQWEKLDSVSWSPVALSDGKDVAFIGSGPTVPALVRLTSFA